jgi:DNA-binding NtrC family response regulator
MSDRPRILVVDDDPAVVELVVETLRDRFDAEGTISAKEALDKVIAEDIDVLVTDVEMPEMRGTELLAAVLERKPGQLVMLITAFGSIELAVQTVRAGACDFVTKPFKSQVLILALDRALRERSMRREIVRLRRELGEGDDELGDLVASSDAMKRVLDIARRAARSDATVLVTGESGSGKGALARWIHARGPRREGPFVQVNCAALPSGLVEAELFGVRRGAFTDARESREGLFVEATGGTILLDEIAEMPIDVQSKLLSVLESSKVRPVGGGEVAVDARVIAATNRSIEQAVHTNEFRIDLFFRLNVIRIEMPPLRERAEDIPELVHALLARAIHGAPGPIGIADDAVRWLVKREWPGNVRELANVVERAVALTEHDTIVLEDVRDLGQRPTGDPTNDILAGAAERQLSLAEVERGYIKRVLDGSGGNVSRAARVLGIDRRTLYRKLSGT